MTNPTSFYLVRHGETEWNVKGLIQGTADSPLTNEGIKQAQNLAKKLNVSFDLVFSSDLLRAKRTAEIIADEKSLEIQTTELLRERNFGPLEGRSSDLFKLWDEAMEKLTEDEKYSYRHLGLVESDKEVIDRFQVFIKDLAVRFPGKNILAVTHGGIMRTILKRLGNYKNLPKHGAVRNTAYIKILTDGINMEIKEVEGIIFND